MSAIQLSFVKPWTVRVPLLSREMESQYVDAFFRDGTLRLNSFDTFRSHPNENRRDQEEGAVVLENSHPNGTSSFIGFSGQEAYIVCASMIEAVLPTAPENSLFRILDTLGFANAIASQIPGFTGGIEGPCSYRANTILRKTKSDPVPKPPEDADVEVWFNEQKRRTGEDAMDKFFLKQSRFSADAEYRFIWFASGRMKPYLDIMAPEAIKFCELLPRQS